jgi:peptidoglycan hydrolase-like protein with peptidoglycan-binding domain
MRRGLVLMLLLAVAAATGAVVMFAARNPAAPEAASAATSAAHRQHLAVAVHVRGHPLSPLHPFGVPRMHYRTVGEGSAGPWVLRLQQLLARRGYLPVMFQGSGQQPLYALSPRNGRFRWRFTAPAELRSQWRAGEFSTITRGAVMSFEADHGLPIDGVAGRRVWVALTMHRRPPPRVPYTYVVVREASPETITIYRDGRSVFTSPANTGIPQAPTALGTYPVYLRYTSTTMEGTNPDGTHYRDTGVPWVSYFNGGDAVHGFLRGSYGSPQSLGCVELPYAAASVAYGLMNYGTLVTVTT